MTKHPNQVYGWKWFETIEKDKRIISHALGFFIRVKRKMRVKKTIKV